MQLFLRVGSAVIVVKLFIERFIYLLQGGRGFVVATGGEFVTKMCVYLHP